MTRVEFARKINDLLPGEHNKRIREGIILAYGGASSVARSVKDEIDNENKIKTGILTNGTTEILSTTSAELDAFVWVIDYSIQQPTGVIQKTILAPHASISRDDYFIGLIANAIEYRAGTTDAQENSFPPFFNPLTEVLLRAVRRNPNGTNEEIALSGNEIINHNETSNKDGGDGTKFYHLGQEDFNKLNLLVNPLKAGVEWTERGTTASKSWRGVTYGNGLFVAIGSSIVMTSPNGSTWTNRTSPSGGFTSVTYGAGLFVAVSSIGNRVMTSPNGIDWTVQTAPEFGWQDVTFGNGLFVAVGNSNQIMTSPDGINWTSRTSPINNSWFGITYGNGIFVAVTVAGTNPVKIISSPDGINWTGRTIVDDFNCRSVAYGNGIFVAVSGNEKYKTSPDGINWTARTSNLGVTGYDIAFGNGHFVTVSVNDTGLDRIRTSTDGITWTTRQAAANHIWYSIAYGDGVFVVVGVNSTGTQGKAMNSIGAKTMNHSDIEMNDGRNPHKTRYEDLEGEVPISTGGYKNVDGGTWDTVYLPSQKLDGGTL